MWPTIVFGGIAALFLLMTVSALGNLRWARRLPPLSALPSGAGPPRCSVVVAARDEEARIEDTVRRLKAQEGVEVEVIVVDDRSTDETGAILARLSAEGPGLRTVRVETLPEGWLGKCHACHVGAEIASGDWILFTDADCWLAPDAIARACSLADRDGVDHVAMTPGLAAATQAARAWHLAFLISLADWFAGVNRDLPGRYFGIGAFNLVRTPVYRRSGGYEALRLTVLDDLRLGLLIRRAGGRTRGFIGGDDVACHWGTTVPSMIKIMEKNYFAAIDFNLGAVLAGVPLGVLLGVGAILGPFSGTVAGWVAGLAYLSSIVPATILTRRLGWSFVPALLVPFIYPALLYAILNSAWVTVRQGGIRWRGTFYALDALKEGAVR